MDITERKKAKQAVRESEEKYHTIFNSANDIIMLMDNKGLILDVNDKLRATVQMATEGTLARQDLAQAEER